MQAHLALIQSLKQEKQNLELVNSRLIVQSDNDRRTIEHLTENTEQFQAEIDSLKSHISQIQFTHQQQVQAQPNHSQEVRVLERKLAQQESQNQTNLSLVYA